MKTLLTIISLLVVSVCANAQSKFAGIWEGTLSAGGQNIRLVFRITEKNGKLSCQMDSPDQGAAGTPATSVTAVGDSIAIDLYNIGILYTGKLWDKETIAGNFMQAGYTFPMSIMKTEKPTELNRPQTPKPPFNYKIEEISYHNTTKSAKFAGTITIPHGEGQFPAILLLSGSGAQNRDEEIFGHKPFAVIADYLTKLGYIVLRVDDRGAGKTVGDAHNVTTADFVKDAYAGVNYLLSRKEVNKEKVGLMGHSEGALVAFMLASERPDINFVISMAGPGVKITKLMEEQTAQVMKSNGADSTFVAEYRRLYAGIINSINISKDSVEARRNILASIKDWKVGLPDQLVMDMGLIEPRSIEGYVQAYIDIYNNKWYNYFLRIDPQPYIQKTTAKILALNGEKDIQVVASTNLGGFRAVAPKSKAKVMDIIELKDMNHLFQTCTLCVVAEYSLLPETISPIALSTVSEWLNKNVK